MVNRNCKPEINSNHSFEMSTLKSIYVNQIMALDLTVHEEACFAAFQHMTPILYVLYMSAYLQQVQTHCHCDANFL